MNIHEVLAAVLRKHLAEGYPAPKAVYLGLREDNALSIEADKRTGNYPHKKQADSPRPTWQGLEVYRVNAEHHIAFS